jgi:activator of 2-hydroxyglutaryl-CoA dehydratase
LSDTLRCDAVMRKGPLDGLRAGFGITMHVPENPRVVAALGAALCNMEKEREDGCRPFADAADQVVHAG